jgi:hypothetical protein
MAVRLFNAHNNVFTSTVRMLCLPDREMNRLSLIMAMTNNTTSGIHHVPPI